MRRSFIGGCLPCHWRNSASASRALSSCCSSAPPRRKSIPALFGDLSWRLIGPFRGGRVLAVAGVPNEPQHFYFGAVNGGVWETKDAGRTWQPIFDEQAGRLDRRDRRRAVGAEHRLRRHRRSRHALGHRARRRHVPLERRRQDMDAHRPRRQPADRQDHRRSARSRTRSSSPRSAIRTARTPSAACSARATAARPGSACSATTMQPARSILRSSPATRTSIYAALWQTRRTPWNIYPPANGPGSGLYKSTDGGDTWKPMRGNGFPDKRRPHRHRCRARATRNASTRSSTTRRSKTTSAASIDPTMPARAGSASASDDRIWQRGWYFNRIAVDPKNADRVYVMNTIVLRSDDGGAHFIALKGDPTGDDFHEMWIDPDNADRQILGVDQGAIVTLNGGKTWSTGSTSRPRRSITSAPTTAFRIASTARSRIPARPRCRAAPAKPTASRCANSTRSPPAAKAT